MKPTDGRGTTQQYWACPSTFSDLKNHLPYEPPSPTLGWPHCSKKIKRPSTAHTPPLYKSQRKCQCGADEIQLVDDGYGWLRKGYLGHALDERLKADGHVELCESNILTTPQRRVLMMHFGVGEAAKKIGTDMGLEDVRRLFEKIGIA